MVRNEEIHEPLQRKRLAGKKWDMERFKKSRQKYQDLLHSVKRGVAEGEYDAYK